MITVAKAPRTPRKRTPALQLVCACSRNLAKASYDSLNPSWTRGKITVVANPGVSQDDYRPWEEQNLAGSLLSHHDAPAEDADFDWHSRTYTWRCKCGRTLTRRHEWVGQEWARVNEATGGRYDRTAWRVVLSD